MATNRIAINRTTVLGARIDSIINQLEQARGRLLALSLVLGADGYNGDASLQTDIGISATDQTKLQNLVTQAVNEMTSTATTQVNVGNATGIRQLIDALSTGG
jgi:hypothetical protein